MKLDNWGNDFERGDVDEYMVEAMDVGKVLMVHLHNDQGGWWYKNADLVRQQNRGDKFLSG